MEKDQENSKDAAKKREQQRMNDIKKDLSEKYKKMQSKFIVSFSNLIFNLT